MHSTLGKIKKITDLRSVWAHEEYDFSSWLSEEENLALLSDAIGIDIVLEELECCAGHSKEREILRQRHSWQDLQAGRVIQAQDQE